MLKLKDNINLKELEKYGFINKCGMCWKPKYNECSVMEITILEDKTLKIAGVPDLFHTVEDTIYKLTKDNLIELVDEAKENARVNKNTK